MNEYKVMEKYYGKFNEVICVCKCQHIVQAVLIVDALRKYREGRPYSYRVECSAEAREDAVWFYDRPLTKDPGFDIEAYFEWK